MKIIPLTLGNFAVSKQKVFTSLHHNPDADGLKMAITPFLIITDNDYILLDCGINFEIRGENLLEALQGENINPGHITKILLSHLHKDHLDGIGKIQNGVFTSNFPNAEIFLQKRELDFAKTQNSNPSYNMDIINLLDTLPNLIFLNQDRGNIGNNITYEISGSHTPFHQIFWIADKAKTVFYAGDNLPQENYLKYHIAYKSDYDGKKAAEQRDTWSIKAHEEKWTILLYHDMNNTYLKL